jgi:hypothetical protein
VEGQVRPKLRRAFCGAACARASICACKAFNTDARVGAIGVLSPEPWATAFSIPLAWLFVAFLNPGPLTGHEGPLRWAARDFVVAATAVSASGERGGTPARQPGGRRRHGHRRGAD